MHTNISPAWLLTPRTPGRCSPNSAVAAPAWLTAETRAHVPPRRLRRAEGNPQRTDAIAGEYPAAAMTFVPSATNLEDVTAMATRAQPPEGDLGNPEGHNVRTSEVPHPDRQIAVQRRWFIGLESRARDRRSVIPGCHGRAASPRSTHSDDVEARPSCSRRTDSGSRKRAAAGAQRFRGGQIAEEGVGDLRESAGNH